MDLINGWIRSTSKVMNIRHLWMNLKKILQLQRGFIRPFKAPKACLSSCLPWPYGARGSSRFLVRVLKDLWRPSFNSGSARAQQHSCLQDDDPSGMSDGPQWLVSTASDDTVVTYCDRPIFKSSVEKKNMFPRQPLCLTVNDGCFIT